jgi:hypothetical protein
MKEIGRMSKKIILGILLAIFMLLVEPAVSSVENSQVIKTREELIIDIDKDALLEKIKTNPFEIVKRIKAGDFTCEQLFRIVFICSLLILASFGILGIFLVWPYLWAYETALDMGCEWTDMRP